MKTAPLPENEADRLAALRASGLLDAAPEKAFDDFTKIAAALCRMPIALISLVDERRQWFKSRVGLEATETPRDVAFCAHAILEPDPLVVQDARLDERFADNPLVQGDPGVRFYAGVPLRTLEGHALGTLCVIDREPRELSPENLDLLRSLARQVTTQIELRRLAREFDRTNAEMRELQHHQEEFIAAISHDLRSPLATTAGFADLLIVDGDLDADKRREFLLHIADATEQSLRLSSNLIDAGRFASGRVALEREVTDTAMLLAELHRRLANSAMLEGVELNLEVSEDLPRLRIEPDMIKRAITNLATNAFRHAPEGTPVRLEARREDASVRISVCDRGVGVRPEERSRLFTRYASLSGVKGSAGLGLYIVRQLVEAHGGSVGYESPPEGGSVFSIFLPVEGD